MADSFLDAVLSKSQYLLSEISDTQRTELNFFKSPESAAFLALKQTSTMRERMVNGFCDSWEIIWQIPDQTTVGTGSASVTANCVIDPDQTFSAEKTEYNVLRHFERAMVIRRQDCNSKIKFEQRLTAALRSKMQEISLEWNAYVISQVVANTQTATNLGDFGTSIVAGAVQYPKADLLDAAKWEQRLADWDNIADMELLPANKLILNGNNFLIAKRQAAFNAANDNQRSQALIMASEQIWWDNKGFNDAGINDTSFLIDPNAICILHRNQYPTNPINELNGTNDRVWSLPLTYINSMGQVATMTYKKDGQNVPLMVDVKLQLFCNSADAVDGITVNDWNLELKLAADFVMMPAATLSGIVKIEAV